MMAGTWTDAMNLRSKVRPVVRDGRAKPMFWDRYAAPHDTFYHEGSRSRLLRFRRSLRSPRSLHVNVLKHQPSAALAPHT